MTTIVLWFPPSFVIGEVDTWPVVTDTFTLRRSAVMQNMSIPTPQGMQQVVGLIDAADMDMHKDTWAGSRPPKPEESELYTRFRAASSGLTIDAGPPLADISKRLRQR